MGTQQDRKRGDCRLVVGPEETAAARSAWPDAPIVALVEASEPAQAVLARAAGADVVVPAADLAAGWRDDTPGLALAVAAASSLAERRAGLRDGSRRSTHDLGQALSAINLASELALGEAEKDERMLAQIRTQALEAGVHAWRAGRAGRSTLGPLRPVDLSSLLHRLATVETDVAVYDSTGPVWVLGDESRLGQVLEELLQHGRRSSTTQRIDVRLAAPGLVELAIRGAGRPRWRRPGPAADTEAELELATMVETVSDMGGRLEADPSTGDRREAPAGPDRILRLSLPLLPDGHPGADLVEVPPDRMAIQTAILEGVLRHAPLSESLEAIVSAIEQQLPGTTCSVLLLDDDGRCLHHRAGAGLPEAYRREIDGVAIGYGQGSCGTAAFLARPVIAPDVGTHPHWTNFKRVALEHDLHSCWSTPILAADGGAVLGTFAVYRDRAWEPDEAATRLVSRFTYLAAVAIGHHRLFTAVAESESRFRSAFEGATVGMALVSLDGTFLMVNPALCAMLETDEASLDRGNLLDLVALDRRQEIRARWQRLVADPDVRATGDRDQEAIETALLAKPDQDPLWVSLRSSLVTSDDGQQPSLYVEIRDITASRRHAVERRAREAAEAASRAKSELLALVSHELRTPLNAILGFAQVMRLVDLDADQRAESLENIMGAGRHLLELINELLDLSQIEAGRLSTAVEDIGADEVIGEALQIVRPLAESRQIGLARGVGTRLADVGLADAVTGPGPAATLRADRQAVRQVLINLLANAVKFTPAGGEVGVVVGPAETGGVRIQVVDSGPGIPAEAIGGLFEPFHRVAPDAHPTAEGTGLGLSVSARLVEQMQGRIGVESRLGVGSCFWVDLPGAIAPPPASLAPAERVGTTGERAARSNRVEHRDTTGLVLYVEDDPAGVELVTAALALRPGVTLVTAGTAAQGLAMARTQAIDAILLDIGLPDVSGWELMRTLRDHPATASIPVVVLTAGTITAPPDTPAPELIMTKPFDVSACIEAIDELLAEDPTRSTGASLSG